MATTVALTHYPVKGCAGISVEAAELTPAGLRHDRTFMTVAPDGAFRSQRTDPRLALVRPEISPDGERLTLRAPGMDTFVLDVALDRERYDVTLFAKPFRAIGQGSAAGEWFSEFLGVPSRLVRVPPEHRRVTSGLTPGTAAFADAHPLLVVSRASLDALNERIVDGGGTPVPMDRFRPNLVIDGWEQPHTEDRVRSLTVGEAELGYAKLCIRCAVTTVDQRTGARAGPDPLRTLGRYRRAAEGGVAFGTKAAVVRPGKVSVGDEVAVGSWGPSELGG